ncbi:hypothetical protein D3C72_1326170 [compost metagenome]
MVDPGQDELLADAGGLGELGALTALAGGEQQRVDVLDLDRGELLGVDLADAQHVDGAVDDLLVEADLAVSDRGLGGEGGGAITRGGQGAGGAAAGQGQGEGHGDGQEQVGLHGGGPFSYRKKGAGRFRPRSGGFGYPLRRSQNMALQC